MSITHFLTHTHTHAHAHMHTHARIHVHTHAHARMHARTHTHAHAHMHTCTHTHACMHTCMHTCMRTHTHTHTHAHTHTRTRIHTRTHAHAHTHTHRVSGLFSVCNWIVRLPHHLGGPNVRPKQHLDLHCHLFSHWLHVCDGLQGTEHRHQTGPAREPPSMVFCNCCGRVHHNPDELPQQGTGYLQYVTGDSNILCYVHYAHYYCHSHFVQRVGQGDNV